MSGRDSIERALRELVAALAGSLVPGNLETTLRIGDVTANVRIQMEWTVDGAARTRYAKVALAELAALSYRDECYKSVRNRSPWSTRKFKTCEKPVTGAIVRELKPWVGSGPPRLDFTFACAQHLAIDGVTNRLADASAALAIVTFGSAALSDARKQRDARIAEIRLAERDVDRGLR